MLDIVEEIKQLKREKNATILAHYYQGTTVETGPSPTVRVLLTGYADSLVDEKVAQWKLVDAWISKPIDSAALKEAVSDALSRRRAS